MNEDKRIIEISGVKFEIDVRTAKRIDCYKVGDRVKILVRSYSDTFHSYHGVIVAFDDFTERPSFTVCYIDNTSEGRLTFVTINKDTKDAEICACNDDVLIEKADVINRIEREVEKKKLEIEELIIKRNYFETRFGQWFKQPTEKINNA